MTGMRIGERPPCHNRPDRPAFVVVHAHMTPDGRQGLTSRPFFSDNRCQTWAGNDHRIFDPGHRDFGTNKGDHYPRAMGFARHCLTCRHRPAEATE